ncbi:phenylacetic acid degradation bifunctional protein PaaZ [Pseudaestuariivita atlantica]|uniref:Enoyl-CoA hydratase n=1 Tax=Pseudaestuariivita atlantica TaxID=1317121 RepID=A0A0L1JNG4_9RHOB|nr:phenylacetic acid degradation bifunctional protein PaaZ [Pseudaestuariivita atlantica]KNG93262.1 enoyl-CoA hydratase [Pseudaestuariivita atlantica]
MTGIDFSSYACGAWVAPSGDLRPVASALDGAALGQIGSGALDFAAMRDHARRRGAPALRAMGFHDRARRIKALALHLRDHREALYQLSYLTGATLADSKIDIDGGIGTLLVFASKGRREMPDGDVYVDGAVEQLSRNGTFVGQHICTPLDGVAVHINAFNFPVWGMLEKLGPCLLAGMPAILKPASSTAYLAQAAVRLMIDSGILPDGAVQLVMGGTGDLLGQLGGQDVISFTGSADTALHLRQAPNIAAEAVRFIAEQDSLNASVLGPDATPDTPEWDLFLREVVTEMTAKAGQKCTAIRRILVPDAQIDRLGADLSARLSALTIGDPRQGPDMGALASLGQRDDVRSKTATLMSEATLIHGDPDATSAGTDANGAYLSPVLLRCDDPDGAAEIHRTEAFGPVATLMPYTDIAHAARLTARAGGALVTSLVTHDPATARTFTLDAARHHGRVYLNDRTSMAESTGHGSPLPHMVHGGPGRAGGGEEMGGIRGVMHYMQRTAVQGSPDMLTAITAQFVPGSAQPEPPAHPFTRTFHELAIGDTLHTASRTITLDDIEHFAHFTGDTFYAHMDEEAAKANPFFPGRVAHGYLLLSFAAGLFVDPDPGPVLANTGLTGLAFQKPVSPGDSLAAALTVKRKTRRTDSYGEVRWHVALTNQSDEPVATYELHTMVAYDRP